MSAAAVAAAPPVKSKKKLIVIVAVLVLVLAAAGAAAVVLLKKKAQAEEASDDAAATPAHAVHDPKAVPLFVPLDPFTVNLADRAAERFAQIGVTLEITDAKVADQIKAYMPAIRNNILLAIADRTAGELMGREGKDKLALKLKRETARALGYAVDAEPETSADEATADGAKPAKPAKRKIKQAPLVQPVKAVHFSNFIIQ